MCCRMLQHPYRNVHVGMMFPRGSIILFNAKVLAYFVLFMKLHIELAFQKIRVLVYYSYLVRNNLPWHFFTCG